VNATPRRDRIASKHSSTLPASAPRRTVCGTFVVQIESGKVTNLAVDPGPLDVPYQFAIRASAETWREFGAAVPAPMYHGIWAASFQRDMRLEGDLLVLMQNLRCVTRQIELLRVVGSPV
jgi:hypothetical protein